MTIGTPDLELTEESEIPAGELPSGWAWATIRELCAVNPRGFDRLPADDELVSQVPMALVESETGRLDASQHVPFGRLKKKSLTCFQEGDVLFAKITPCMENGKIALAEGLAGGRGLGSTEYHVLRSRGAVLPRFLMHYLLQPHVRRQAERHMTGAVGQRRVPRPYLEGLRIPVPPLLEQHRIVAELEAHLDRVSGGEAALGSALEQSRAYEAGVLAQATYLNPKAHEWSVSTIGKLADVTSGATPLRGNSEYYQDGNIPWVTSSLLNDPFVMQSSQFITAKALRETSVKLFPAGTLLLAMYGEGKTRGKCSELLIAATTNQACAGIQMKPGQEIRKPWVKALLQARYEQNRSMAWGGVQQNLSLSLIKGIPVPLPPLELQDQLLEGLAQSLAAIDAIRNKIAQARRDAQALRASLLRTAFAGRLVPQNPDEESAPLLLLRARAVVPIAAPRKRAANKLSTPRTAV